MTPLATAFAAALVIFIIIAAYTFNLYQKNAANSFYLVNPTYADSEMGGSTVMFVGHESGPKSTVPLVSLVGKNATVNTRNCGMLKGKVVSAVRSDGTKMPKMAPKNTVVLAVKLNVAVTQPYVFDPTDCVTIIV
jgi:hypothetical protein